MVVNIDIPSTAHSILEKESLWRITHTNLNNALSIINDRYVDLLCIETDLATKQLLDVLKEIKNKRLRTKIISIIPNSSNLKHIMLSYGSDDYLTKPYSPEDLILRCKNLIHCIPTQYEIVYQFNSLRYEQKWDRVMYDNIYLPFTPKEINVVKLLIKRRFASKQEISQYLGSKDGLKYSESYVTVIMHRIREKIRLCTGRDLIRNSYGKGYTLKY